ncbi:hypothetical protein RRG08_005901 [Elysia crispata]|uniref:Uncharacterized protein n=1 Tax=Elysia crispata TaxID=231223 RepID=A0AAE0Y5H1_9GAST|nr:hypothetical protein RRG08_005901 [Elysia crispata]
MSIDQENKSIPAGRATTKSHLQNQLLARDQTSRAKDTICQANKKGLTIGSTYPAILSQLQQITISRPLHTAMW